MNWFLDGLSQALLWLVLAVGFVVFANILTYSITKSHYAAKVSAKLETFKQLTAMSGRGQHPKEDDTNG